MMTREQVVDLRTGLLEKMVREQPGFEHATLKFLCHTINSSLFELFDAVADRKYFVKVPLDTESAPIQYESLITAYSAFNSSSLKVPAPHFFIPQYGAYCMDYIEGSNLKSIVSSAIGSSRIKLKHASSAGRWLKHYHQTFSQGSRAFCFDKNLEELSSNLQVMTENDSAVEFERTIAEWLFRNYKTAQQNPISWGKYHGDYKTDNLIISNGEIYGVDFFVYHDGNQYQDLIQFQNNIVLLQFQSIGLRVGTTSDKLIRAFFEAYFEDETKIPFNLLAWLHTYRLLDLLKVFKQSKGVLASGRAAFLTKKLAILTDKDL